MGESGTILHWRFTRGESFDEVRDVFTQLRERLRENNVMLEGIIIHNCCKWKNMLSDAFPGVQIKLDLFHAVQRFLTQLPKRSRLTSEITKEYGLIFRPRHDLGEKRLHATPDPDTILRNIASFEHKWYAKTGKDGSPIVNDNAKKAIHNIKIHIKKGCTSSIPSGYSTSRNERLHRELNSIFKANRIGLELAHLRCSRLFFRTNNWDENMFNSRLCCPEKESKSALRSEYFG